MRDVPHTSRATGKSWPPLHAYLSIAALCQITEQDRKTVITNLQWLQEKGFITRAGTDGQTNQVTVYSLSVASPKNGPGTCTENGTSTKNGTVPIFPDTSPNFPIDQSQFSLLPVPKTGHETVRKPVKPKKPIKKQSRLPENFEPNSTGCGLIESNGLNLSNELEAFKNHHTSKGSLFLDWQAAWRTWVGNAVKFNANSTKRTSSSRHTGFDKPGYYGDLQDGIPD